MKIEGVRRLVRKRAKELGGQAEFARQAGVTRQAVSVFLAGKRNPSDGMLVLIGVTREVMYRRVYSRSCAGRPVLVERRYVVCRNPTRCQTS